MPDNINTNPERTFTQDEVNKLIGDRLKQERAKLMREAQEREAELNRREALLTAKADWTKRGLPADLLDSLDLTREGALDTAAAVLEKYQANRAFPSTGGVDPAALPPESGGRRDGLRDAFGLRKEG